MMRGGNQQGGEPSVRAHSSMQSLQHAITHLGMQFPQHAITSACNHSPQPRNTLLILREQNQGRRRHLLRLSTRLAREESDEPLDDLGRLDDARAHARILGQSPQAAHLPN